MICQCHHHRQIFHHHCDKWPTGVWNFPSLRGRMFTIMIINIEIIIRLSIMITLTTINRCVKLPSLESANVDAEQCTVGLGAPQCQKVINGNRWILILCWSLLDINCKTIILSGIIIAKNCDLQMTIIMAIFRCLSPCRSKFAENSSTGKLTSQSLTRSHLTMFSTVVVCTC